MNKPFLSRFDYIVGDDAPSKAVEQRFERMMSEAFDGEGRLRVEHRPTPKPQPPKKAATSLFTIDMDSGSGRLPPYVS